MARVGLSADDVDTSSSMALAPLFLARPAPRKETLALRFPTILQRLEGKPAVESEIDLDR